MKPILISKLAKELDRIDLVQYSIECPYCLKTRIYRFDTNIKSGVKCKCCQESFAVRYFTEEEEYQLDCENTELVQCDKCEYVWNVDDLRSEQKLVNIDGNLISKTICDCGSDKFSELIILNK